MGRRALLLIATAFLFFATAALPRAAEPLTIYAAASFTDVVNAVAIAFERETGRRVRLVATGSSTAARQIDAGAPADLFISANADWMDYLGGRSRIVAETRANVAANRLVVIAPSNVAEPFEFSADALIAQLGEGRLAIGDPDHVPAGIYARAALTSTGAWDRLSRRLAPAQNVRVALAYVAEGAAPLGIVYASDAAAEKSVVAVSGLPDDSHPPIVYPAAAIAGGDVGGARLFLSLLTSAEGHAVLQENGFALP